MVITNVNTGDNISAASDWTVIVLSCSLDIRKILNQNLIKG